ncbi:hypothetical protein CHLRE_04g215600v5 [Chlamydomonas reinhardtii]|uniref:Thiol methyltransferase 2 n=1 Tax=Chlamydomonas reinhardtii TaxID=3055 RepID=A0A2K3DTR3_CHLRE|nr:uncharacterized protein CHLRE_04g215600v5 [Chlamydomonas reinhardtii]XP_042925097.1 uncharacterized protein CHLRE_04g215600v5 [Chlamydomonas reinhardtii]PNW83917.1 hypothetical protein CHLRE_04g215600v5 [Chlamydomonas reinhardtii]PNW83918.1 hypothetical protein CHLRE_04g215600v5 [Chlamydomonas reinhardtii]
MTSNSGSRLNAAGQPDRELPGGEPENFSDRWEREWSAGVGKGQRWDCSAPSPSLVDLLKSGKVNVTGQRVFVPGCGRGYDLPVFRTAGAAQVVGLELAPSAVREAQAYLAELQLPAADAAAIEMIPGDFFKFADPKGAFDLGFDYTFGCAMHPTMRLDWAATWAKNVKSGGTLVTLVFPINPAADPNVGPPFPISPALFRTLLEPAGFEVVSEAPVPAELSHPPRVGKEVLMVWRRK